MPTRKFDSFQQVYQSLTDIEIEDDKNDYPVAVITVAGLGLFGSKVKIKIQMVSDWDYYETLLPMRTKLLNYFATLFANEKDNEINSKKILEKIKGVVEDIGSVKTAKDMEKKANTMSNLFEDVNVRELFFRSLKRMKMIPWHVSYKRYRKCTKPLETCIMFILIWHFNFDGVKKKVQSLLQMSAEILQDTSSQSLTGSRHFTDLDSFKKVWKEAHDRSLAKEREFADNSKN